MIGSGLKKLAQENGLRVSNGVAYGSLRGYAATLSEGSGFKQIVVSTKFSDPIRLQELQTKLNGVNLTREYRVRNLLFGPDTIQIIFNDTVGTMKKVAAFVDWFFPMLPEASAQGADICPECGGQPMGGCWKLINGVAYHMHESCAEKLRGQIAADEETRKQEDTGSYGTGLIGALLGSAVGAVLWAVVLNLGYVASLVGLVIGWLAEKGYKLLHGRQGKGKVAILVVAIIFGVLLGTFGAYAYQTAALIGSGELDLTYGDIPLFLVMLMSESQEFTSGVIGNIVIGLLFAGLGVFFLLRKAGQEVAGTKFIDLQ